MSLSPEAIMEMKQQFDAMDTNKDGFVSKDELFTMFKSLSEEAQPDLKAMEAMVNEMMACADTDHDGKVSFNEFVAAAIYIYLSFTRHNLTLGDSLNQ